MTSPDSTPTNRLWHDPAPSTPELLEAALLDALGLLDDEERDAFDTAFTNARPGVQRQIRDEQQRFLMMDELLPDVEPRADLRRRVLDAVREAQEAAATAPARAVRHDHRRAVPSVRRAPRVHSMWRAAAVGLAVAVVALVTVQLQIQKDYGQLSAEATLEQIMEGVGQPRYLDLVFDESTQRHYFDAVDASSPSQATLFTNADWDRAVLYVFRLPARPGSTYELVALDEDGNAVETLDQFKCPGIFECIDVPLATAKATQVAIRVAGDASNTFLLTARLGSA